MSKVDELRTMRRSFSGDRQVNAHHRSGDREESGGALWDFVAHVQNAEADIIDEEERAERREARNKGVKILRLYLQKVFNEQEKQFIKLLLT